MYNNSNDQTSIPNANNPGQPVYGAPPQPNYDQPPAYYTPPMPDYSTAQVYSVPPQPEYSIPQFDYTGQNIYDEPSQSEYSQENMYTPGIGLNQPPQKTRDNVSDSAVTQASSGSAGGRFMRAACLVVACSLFSAASAYLVTDYRFKNGDFTTTTNQVVLGGTPTEIPEDAYISQPLITSPDGEMSAQDIYDRALTQVVGISVTQPTGFGMFGRSDMVPSVVGSGFIVSEDGYILTNYHVVEMAHQMDMPINVVLHDGESYPATVVGFEASSDVAVLKIEKDGFNPAIIGDSKALRVGQSIYAIGNPFGDLIYTMTDGIVSALDRVVSVDGKTISAFQFSAAVNSGNSGGPIYNTRGEVIGIVTAKVSRGNVEGIGFAIPINDAIDIAAALIEHGYISGRPLLGVTVSTITPEFAKENNMVIGVGVSSVATGSAADKAGILIGDIITAIGDESVESIESLRFALRTFRANETADLTVWRDGKILTLPITFDEDLSAGRPEPTPTISPDIPNPFR